MDSTKRKSENSEIGGEFYLDSLNLDKSANQFVDLLKGFEFEFLVSGRSAISYVINQTGGKNVLLPSYICQSVIDAFEQKSFNIDFYDINKDLTINMQDFEKKCNDKIDIVYFINYYGQIQPNDVLLEIKKQSKLKNFVIIEDTTHSLFNEIKTIGDYCIASLRKWSALPDGAVVYADTENFKKSLIKDTGCHFSTLRLTAMILKSVYLKNDIQKSEDYRQLFSDAEKIIEQSYEQTEITKLSKKILESIDIKTLIEIRKQNYNYLEKNLKNKIISPVLEKNSDNCKLFFPVYIKNRDGFQKYLGENKIYCPIHWPIDDDRLLQFKNIDYISKNIISIPIDQRYNEDDMKFVCNILNNYKG